MRGLAIHVQVHSLVFSLFSKFHFEAKKQKKPKTKQLDFLNFQTFFFCTFCEICSETRTEVRNEAHPPPGSRTKSQHPPPAPPPKNTEQSRYTPRPQVCSQHYNLRIFYHLLKCASHVPHFTSFQSVSETADCSPV